jgi:hypothetical protein
VQPTAQTPNPDYTTTREAVQPTAQASHPDCTVRTRDSAANCATCDMVPKLVRAWHCRPAGEDCLVPWPDWKLGPTVYSRDVASDFTVSSP